MSGEKDSFEAASEYLRLALPLMASHGVPVDPENYAVWYKYVSGASKALNTAIDEMIASKQPIDTVVQEKLHRDHVASAAQTRAESAQQKVKELIGAVSLSLNSAENEVDRYQKSLDASAAILNEDVDSDELRNVVTGLIDSTHQMATSNASLQERLEHNRLETEALREELAAVRRESESDVLTGLANRKGFENRLAELEASEDYRAQAHCLVIGDIDKFKAVNDTYGHIFGDKILKVVAKVFANLTKGKDVAARFGGEEFIVLLPQTDIKGAQVVAESIRAQIERGRVFNPKTNEEINRITISLGVTEIVHGEPIEQTIARADAALYQAKDGGRNRVEMSPIDSVMAKAS